MFTLQRQRTLVTRLDPLTRFIPGFESVIQKGRHNGPACVAGCTKALADLWSATRSGGCPIDQLEKRQDG